ncbi:MAG TPA: hypothetical protein VNW94_15040, partial [Streptosporangiaceae bacterium]|nr:hypothetical protein [Streptosporangiaceae bacterium]
AKSNNFAGIVVGPGRPTGLVYTQAFKVPAPLRMGTHKVDVTVAGGRIKVLVDGKLILSARAPAGSLPSTALVGFTGSTGGHNDVHTVRGVTIGTAPAGGPGAPLTAAPASADFGDGALGHTLTTTVTLKNNSGQPETVNAVTPPPAPYTATLPAVGTVVAPGASVRVPVTFTPTTPAVFPDTFTVSTTSGDVTVALTGSGDPTLPALTSWVTNGLATLGGSTATLTRDGQFSGAGSIVAPQAVSPFQMRARFTAQLGGARTTGADGLTFALLDASATTTKALGAIGFGLGVGGLPATIVALDTYSNGPITSHNFVGVGTTTAGSKLVTFLQTSTAIGALRTGTHTVEIWVNPYGQIYVWIDGKLIMKVKVPALPTSVRVAFTAGVGGHSDTHAVINPTVTYVGAG